MEAMPIGRSRRVLVPQCQEEVMMERDDLLTAQRYPYWNRCYHGDRMECWIMLAAGDNGGFA